MIVHVPSPHLATVDVHLLVVCRHKFRVIPGPLSSLSHLFKGTATNKFIVEFIMWSLASGSPEAESELGIPARDLLGGVLSEGRETEGGREESEEGCGLRKSPASA